MTLRNPFAEPRAVALRLDEAAGFAETKKRYRVATLYPYRMAEAGEYGYGDTIHVQLQAFEERVLQLDTQADSGLQVSGARYRVEANGNGAATLHVYAPAGAHRTVHVMGNADAKHDFALDFGKPGQRESAVMASRAMVEAHARETHVAVTLQIPEDYPKTTIALLFEPEDAAATIEAKATDNGVAAPLATENGKGVWQWFSVGLTPGTHKLEFTLQLPASLTKGGKLSGWAIAERKLAEQTVSIQWSGEGVTTAERAELPVDNAIEKTTMRLVEETIR